MMRRAVFKFLLLCAALAGASAHARAQDAVAPAKRDAIRRLLEVTTPTRHMQHIFERLVSRYEGPWLDSMLKDFRARGLFEKMPPEQAARMERLIKEFSANVFSEIKSRVGRDLNTPESFDPLAVPVFDKYFTLEELNALTAAFQTPAGRKLVEAYPRLMAEATVAALEARGFFDVPPSPEAQEAKMDKFLAELRADPSALYRDVLAAGEREAPKHFDEADAKEWAAFAQTPLGRKLAGESPRFLGELTQNFFLLNGPRVGPLVQEIYQAELEKFAEKLGAAERDGPPPTPRRRTTNRRANRRP